MRILAKIILIVLFIPLFLIFLISINLRFQLLTPSFWDKTFSSDGTYTKLSESINKNLVSQTVAEGGRAGDVRILTDLITPENLRDTISKNINNILFYANGKSNELSVYIPLNKIPESLLSKNIDIVKTDMPLTDFVKEFNIPGISASEIQLVSRLGYLSWLAFGLASFLILLLLCLLYISVNPGKRFVAPGIALSVSGIIALSLTGVGTVIRVNWAKDLAGSSNLGDSIIGIVTPPVIHSLLNVWLYFGIAALVLGFFLFFIKKLGYTKSK